MSETTGIAWTDSTINAWHGCDKVSAGCKNCYAEVSTPVRVKRAAGLEVWGKDAARPETKGWEASLRKWNRAQKEAIARYEESCARGAAPPKPWRVFGQSLSDTFEGRADLDPLRARFFFAIERCSALTFQLLTKRPENILGMVPPSWLAAWPAHVWIGATVESQAMADERIPHLLRVPAPMRFLSVEPQIGPVDLTDLVRRDGGVEHHYSALECDVGHEDDGEWGGATIAWAIQGGESGPKARRFDLAWARSLRDQCRAAGVAHFLKQFGAQPVTTRQIEDVHGRPMTSESIVRLRDSHGGVESEWPADLRGCRAFPEPAGGR